VRFSSASRGGFCLFFATPDKEFFALASWSNTIQPDVISDSLHALRLTALCDNNKSMEFILALVLFLVVVVGIISIDHRLKRIVKILEERERRESDARRIRGLEPL
jgi:hypothetical protein